jgi:hypothetical protein
MKVGGSPMGKATSPSYSITLDLITETFQEHTLDKRFEIARQIYNACLKKLHERWTDNGWNKNPIIYLNQHSLK